MWAAGLSLSLLAAVLLFVLVDRPQEVRLPPPLPDRGERASLAAAALASLEAAVESRDVDAAAALGPDDATGARWAGVVGNAESLRVDDFSLRYVDEDEGAFGAGSARWVGAVQTRWRFAGFDAGAAETEVSFTFEQAGNRAVIVEIGGHGLRSPLWLSGPLTVRRSADTLVLAAGGNDAADRFARYAEQAVPVVRRVLPAWPGSLVVEVPPTADALDAALGADQGTYDQVAAVTATVDGTTLRSAPVHVFVNPTVFDTLRPTGAQVVMSHEATHVATRAAIATTPLWLLEGFADYVALRDVHLPPSVTAAQIIAQVRRDGPPDGLPTDADFDASTTHLGAAYESAWQACVVLADLGGEAALVRFYERVGAGEPQSEALQEVFGVSGAELVKLWQERLQDLAA